MQTACSQIWIRLIGLQASRNYKRTGLVEASVQKLTSPSLNKTNGRIGSRNAQTEASPKPLTMTPYESIPLAPIHSSVRPIWLSLPSTPWFQRSPPPRKPIKLPHTCKPLPLKAIGIELKGIKRRPESSQDPTPLIP